MRGAVFYGAYCSGCHGATGSEGGPVADMLGLDPADLRAGGVLAGASDDAILARLRAGTPFPGVHRSHPLEDDAAVERLDAYLMTLRTVDGELLRAGRLIFEGECAACHGVYGDGASLYLGLPRVPPPDLRVARERYSDAGLARVSVEGTGAMPRLIGGFEPTEMRALIAYVRHLSPGYQLYDTYCAVCHGDDGRGVDPEDLLPPAIAAPRLEPARLAGLDAGVRRATVLHMLRREQGNMPHFRGLVGDDELRDIVRYLRTWEE
jgi:mono/diheme cytochrome c family protein